MARRLHASKAAALMAVLSLLAVCIAFPATAAAGDAPAPASPEAPPATEDIDLARPELKGLITFGKNLDPFRMDATDSRPVRLREVLMLAMNGNLDIGISNIDARTSAWNLAASIGRFLPNARLLYIYQGLKGQITLPGQSLVSSIRFNNPLNIANAGFTLYAYRGGEVVFGALRDRNSLRAARHGRNATISDVLLQATDRYFKLILEEAILKIRIDAVRVAEEQLRLNRSLFEAGSATTLDVMQAQTQLYQDRQRLIDQQVTRRVASIELADFLNLPQDVDLIPADLSLQKIRLMDDSTSVGRLLETALTHRPELKRLEEERLAARKDVIVRAARLHPNLRLDGNIIGVGETLGKSERTETLAPIGLGDAPASVRVNKQIKPLYAIGLWANWNFEGLGTTDLAAMQAAKLVARRALLTRNKEANKVLNQVRQAYLNVFRTDQQIDEAIVRVQSTEEELRLARLRFEHGFGKNIDILRAQEAFTDARVGQATAVVNYNIAQAQLLRDIGVISIDRLTSAQPWPGN